MYFFVVRQKKPFKHRKSSFGNHLLDLLRRKKKTEMLRAWLERLVGIKTFAIVCLFLLVAIFLYCKFHSYRNKVPGDFDDEEIAAAKRVMRNQRMRDITNLSQTVWDGNSNNLIRESEALCIEQERQARERQQARELERRELERKRQELEFEQRRLSESQRDQQDQRGQRKQRDKKRRGRHVKRDRKQKTSSRSSPSDEPPFYSSSFFPPPSVSASANASASVNATENQDKTNEESLELVQVRNVVGSTTVPTIFDFRNKLKAQVKRENDSFLDPGPVIVPEVRSAGEELCKKILEEDLFPGKKFETYRPNFLKREKTGRNLEIDLYNPELKLGVEFNGSQHYIMTPQFHKSGKGFKSSLIRDELKKKRCKTVGVTLIVIPFTINTYHEIKDFLEISLKKQAPHLLPMLKHRRRLRT